ncbi:hypothetical protein ABEB36_012040 [Hypothenemus hampei]|uniref:Nibrin n=1 Tax=Hypothenemus hampei TaxID=57062 RepID=A0ABD1E9U5_HYPHA
MVLLLINTCTGKTINISEEKVYTIGRKNCDILLENDDSISRLHAKLTVKQNEVTLEDCKSRYSTLHITQKLIPFVPVHLKHLDLIKFGIFNSKFRFESYQFVVAGSVLSTEKKALLKECLDKCGGYYVEKWTDYCTHLTVEKASLTVKFLQALVNEKHIVTINYWTDYVKSIESKQNPPNIEYYNKPPIAEQLLSSDFKYKVDPNRRTLFKEKIFVFFDKNCKDQLSDVIQNCGGQLKLFSEEPDILNNLVSNNNLLLIKTDNEQENPVFQSVANQLKKFKKRPIPLKEIALAVITCSCEVNCNATYNKALKVFTAGTEKIKSQKILAMETQTQHEEVNGLKEKIEIPCPEPQLQLHLSKRPNPEIVEKRAKKIKLENSKETFVNSAKKTKDFNRQESSLKRPALSDIPGTSNQYINPFTLIKPAKRRKPNEELNINPFACIQKPKSTSKKVEKPLADVVSFPEIKQEDVTIKIEKSALIQTSIQSPGKWLSKNSPHTIPIKTEKEEEGENLEKMVKAFDDCVVEIKKIPLRTKDVSNVTLDGTVNGQQNFKKFKKVQPLKPQVTVIGRHQLKKYGSGDDSDTSAPDLSEDDRIETRFPTRQPSSSMNSTRRKFCL